MCVSDVAFLPSYFTCNGWTVTIFLLSLIFWISSSRLSLIIVFGCELLFFSVVLISLIKSLIGSVFTFFKNSYADEIKLLDESISFKRTYSGTVTFKIVNSNSKQNIYESIKGPIILETKNMAEVMFLTKVIGNYNINKIGNTFIFENDGWAVALERIQ